jgi:hypothetical protein
MSTGLDSRILAAVAGHPFWDPYLRERIATKWQGARLHIAVFTEPFLGHVLSGRKTIESRFSVRRTVPFGSVSAGDVIALKDSGGPLVGLCRVEAAWFYRLTARSWNELQQQFAGAMCAEDPRFWEERQGRTFGTLLQITDAAPIRAVSYPKRDRRGWVVELPSSNQLDFTEGVL